MRQRLSKAPPVGGVGAIETEEHLEVKTVIGGPSLPLVVEGSRDEASSGVMMSVREQEEGDLSGGPHPHSNPPLPAL
ncbi:hypothetical protein PBY51_000107 [Eleginops maclovinus]|uniref:Uncharacterized protein n=1 Tax=Eleginops maclovinus TaxID=56733 RepID=A0AAN8AQ42_ELEMC|nr:hypothetical protein PBY51_000107 [Eleginops maclovinus]